MGGGGKRTAAATERPCLLSPTTPPPPGPGGCWAGAGPLSSCLLALPLFCRDRCASGQIVSLKCSGESPPGSGKEALGEGGLPHAPRVGKPQWEARLGLGGCLAHPPTGPFLQSCQNRAPWMPLFCPHQPLIRAGNLLASPPALASDTPSPSSGASQRGSSSFWSRRRAKWETVHGVPFSRLPGHLHVSSLSVLPHDSLPFDLSYGPGTFLGPEAPWMTQSQSLP